jgi:hypothetical protein
MSGAYIMDVLNLRPYDVPTYDELPRYEELASFDELPT